jgi:hypothetical protein
VDAIVFLQRCFQAPRPGREVREVDSALLSAMLYFDKLHLPLPLNPGISPIRDEEFIDSQELGRRMQDGSATVDDVLLRAAQLFASNYARFQNDYGVLEGDAWVRPNLTAAAEAAVPISSAGFATIETVTDLWTSWARNSIELVPELEEWLRINGHDPGSLAASVLRAGDLGLAMHHIRRYLEAQDPDTLTTTDAGVIRVVIVASIIFDIIQYIGAIALLQAKPLFLHDIHVPIFRWFASELTSGSSLQLPISESISTQISVLSQVHAELPLVRPRSPEDVAIIRNYLKDELGEFRRAVEIAAEDLNGAPSDAAIAREAKRRFADPLERLKRRLNSPARELMQAMASTPTVLTSVLCLVGRVPGGITTAAVAGALATSLRVTFERTGAIRESGVGYLYRVERLHSRDLL